MSGKCSFTVFCAEEEQAEVVVQGARAELSSRPMKMANSVETRGRDFLFALLLSKVDDTCCSGGGTARGDLPKMMSEQNVVEPSGFVFRIFASRSWSNQSVFCQGVQFSQYTTILPI